jgi:nitroreductase
MEFNKLVKKRRSIRKYKQKNVSEDKIRKILEYGIQAPSSSNTQSWQFTIVRDTELKNQLSKVHKYCDFVKDAPVVIIAGSDSEKCPYHPSGILSVAAAVENILLGAANEDLGACWTYIKDYDEKEIEQRVRSILNIPSNIELIAMIPVGYPDETPGKKRVEDLKDKIRKDKWN